MEYAFESPAFAVVGENQLAHRLAIQHVAVEYFVAEFSSNLGECRRTSRHNFPCNDVGIDNGYAKVGEEIGDGRLAAGDATGEADA
jgi:hypothetical protein